MGLEASPGGQNAEVLNPGDPAPQFSVADQDGEPFSDANLGGKWTVLWWYPIANTAG